MSACVQFMDGVCVLELRGWDLYCLFFGQADLLEVTSYLHIDCYGHIQTKDFSIYNLIFVYIDSKDSLKCE